MAEEEKRTPPQPTFASPPESSSHPEDPPLETSTPPEKFDPSRMIGIIKRKVLIKDLASAYHTECLAYCQELINLQKRQNEPFLYIKAPEDLRNETLRFSSKRAKKRLV